MDGEEHRRERHLLMPVFHGERMRSYGAIMREAAERELARWPRHDTVIVRPGMTRITLEVICRCLFGQADGVHTMRSSCTGDTDHCTDGTDRAEII